MSPERHMRRRGVLPWALLCVLAAAPRPSVAAPCPLGQEPGPGGKGCVRPTFAPVATEAGPAGIIWVGIPGGVFLMGEGGDAHRVKVQSFQICKTEVTLGQFRACARAGHCEKPDLGPRWENDRDDLPVTSVRWPDARRFCEWVGARLPSEAEWEYAARSGGKDQRYPWGNEAPTCRRAVMMDGCGEGRARMFPVCSKSAGNTEQGVCDLSGNVWEWVEDCWHGSYAGAPADGTAWVASCEERVPNNVRVIRGGSSFHVEPVFLRAIVRGGSGQHAPRDDHGFRCAKTP